MRRWNALKCEMLKNLSRWLRIIDSFVISFVALFFFIYELCVLFFLLLSRQSRQSVGMRKIKSQTFSVRAGHKWLLHRSLECWSLFGADCSTLSLSLAHILSIFQAPSRLCIVCKIIIMSPTVWMLFICCWILSSIFCSRSLHSWWAPSIWHNSVVYLLLSALEPYMSVECAF